MKKHTLKKEKDFVQISNRILINPDISLKAKGMLSLILSLPENWDFSIEGIASKCKESKESIRTALKELEKAGYIKRSRMRSVDGKITKMEYEIFEEPYKDTPSSENQELDTPKKVTFDMGNPTVNNIKNNNIKNNNTKSNLSISHTDSDIDKYRERIKYNIDYDILVERDYINKYMLDEIIELMTETICSEKELITISGNAHCTEYVKNKFLKIDSSHIEYILECMENTTTKIGNIKQYLLATIFNAPTTINSYYNALARNNTHC